MEVTAAVLRRSGEPRPYDESRPLALTRLELAPPQRGEALVRVRAAGLCHSDLSTIDGSRERPVPMAIGHEIAGEVVECGPGAAEFAAGDKVVASFVPACGSCEHCAGGAPAMCEAGAAANGAGALLGGGRRLSEPGGEEVHHHLGVSGFADHVVVSERSLVAIDQRVPWEIAALFGCAVLTGVGAVVNAAGVKLGDTVAVFGLGGVGLAAVLGAVAAGAERVAVVDPVAEKRELALELGATHAFDAGPEVVAEVRAALDGGAEHAIETAGIASVLAQAFAATRRGGQTTTVGLPAPGVDLAIPAVQVTAEERTLRGSYLGSCVPRRDVPRFVAMYLAGRLPVERLLSHRLAPEQLNEGFERLAAARANRQVVVFD
jgi:Zn-dependent alcohol dehydrogenase